MTRIDAVAPEAVEASARPPLRMTYEEFLEWADEDTRAEWVEGEVVFVMPPTLAHQLLAGFLFRIVAGFVEHFALGVVICPPFQMKLGPPEGGSGREPDLLFIARERTGRLLDSRLEGPADLVVEIVSPDSVTRDRYHKYREYEAAGVREYWLLDYRRRAADFYRLNASGTFDHIFPDADGVYRSDAVPGFWLRVDWLWQEPLPAGRSVLQELGVL